MPEAKAKLTMDVTEFRANADKALTKSKEMGQAIAKGMESGENSMNALTAQAKILRSNLVKLDIGSSAFKKTSTELDAVNKKLGEATNKTNGWKTSLGLVAEASALFGDKVGKELFAIIALSEKSIFLAASAAAAFVIVPIKDGIMDVMKLGEQYANLGAQMGMAAGNMQRLEFASKHGINQKEAQDMMGDKIELMNKNADLFRQVSIRGKFHD